MGIPLLSGREFDIRDSEPAPKVAIVNETLAARLWPGTNPLGRSIQIQKSTLLVVGLARKSKYGSVWQEPQPSLYVASLAGRPPGKLSDLADRPASPGDSAAAVARDMERHPAAPAALRFSVCQ